MSKFGGVLLFIALMNAPSAQAKGWLMSACDRLLGWNSASQEVTPEMRKVLESIRHETDLVNRYWAGRLKAELEPVPELVGSPMSVAVSTQIPNSLEWVAPIKLRMIVNPNYLSADWRSESEGLGKMASAFLLFDDIRVHYNGHSHLLSEVMKAEVERINTKTPGLGETIHIVPAEEFDAAKLSLAMRGKTVVWIQGSMMNFQLARSLLLSLQESAGAILVDPAYVRPKP